MNSKTVGEVVDAWTTHRTKRYRFYIEIEGGEVEWVGLTQAQAKTMYRVTSKHADVKRYGWEEMK